VADQQVAERDGRLRVGRVMSATLDLLATHRRACGVLFLVFAALNLIGEIIAERGGGQSGSVRFQDVVQAGVVALVSVALVRTLLGASPRWRLDGGALIFAASDFSCSLVLPFWTGAGGFALSPGAGLAGFVLGGAAWIAAGLAIWHVYIRISLWTYGQAVGARGISIADSWRGMRGATWAIIGASILLAILPSHVPSLLLDALAPNPRPGLEKTLALILDAAFGAWFSLAVVAIPAAVYRLRAGRSGPGAVAELFD
jgi:hypothetical protein